MGLFKTLTTYGLGTVSLLIGAGYSIILEQGTDFDGWIALLERLGLPLIFLFGILWMFWKGAKAVAPFAKERIEQLTSFPEEQFKAEREERLQKQVRFEDIISRISSDHNQTIKEISQQNANTQATLAQAISDLARQIEVLAKQVGKNQ